VDTYRHGNVADEGFRGDEGRRALIDAGRQQAPEDDAGGDVGQRLADVLLEQCGEDQAHRADHDAHAQRQPEWAKHGTAEALADIVEGEMAPQRVAPPALDQVRDRLPRHTCGRDADDGFGTIETGGCVLQERGVQWLVRWQARLRVIRNRYRDQRRRFADGREVSLTTESRAI